MNQRMLILEVNEVPLRIFREFAGSRQGSYISRLLESSQVMETRALDVDRTFLYPSQTWASLNAGAPYGKHQIHWYNDPKPAEYPLYWRLLADKGISIGAIGTLHSSPAAPFAEKNEHYKFIIPDCFAPDSYTKPRYLQPLQSLNLRAVKASGRTASLRIPMREVAVTLVNWRRYGIRLKSMSEVAQVAIKILRKKVNRERLRNLQFPLMADVFLRQLERYQPDVAILFTNHVAANMHRYWAGLYPGDYRSEIYGAAWRAKYQGEILAAMELLDRYAGELMRVAEATNRILVVVSSMGQEANSNLTPDDTKQTSSYRLDDVKKFVSQVTQRLYPFEIRSAMVPQYTVVFENQEKATAAVGDMHRARSTMQGIGMNLHQNLATVTIAASLDPMASQFRIGGQSYTHKDLGFIRLEIDDHHSGHHCPEGTLIIYNSETAKAARSSIDYLEYAPALLKHFGLPRPSYMQEPSFRF
jgi:hypothetical protein